MLISNTYITDNSSPARILSFKKWSHVVFWSDAPPSTDLPITESVVLQHLGCQLCSSNHSCRYKRVALQNVGSCSLSGNLESGWRG